MFAQPILRLLRYCVAPCLLTISMPASADADCTIPHYTFSGSVQEVLKQHNGYTFKNYKVVCDKLRRANAKLVILGEKGVASTRAFAWTQLALADRDNDFLISLSGGSKAAHLSTDATNDTASKLLWGIINDALDDWAENGLDVALADLDKIRQTFQKAAAQR